MYVYSQAAARGRSLALQIFRGMCRLDTTAISLMTAPWLASMGVGGSQIKVAVGSAGWTRCTNTCGAFIRSRSVVSTYLPSRQETWLLRTVPALVCCIGSIERSWYRRLREVFYGSEVRPACGVCLCAGRDSLSGVCGWLFILTFFLT